MTVAQWRFPPRRGAGAGAAGGSSTVSSAAASPGAPPSGEHRAQHHRPDGGRGAHLKFAADARVRSSSAETPSAAADRDTQPPKTVSARGSSLASRAPQGRRGRPRNATATSAAAAPATNAGRPCFGEGRGRRGAARSPRSHERDAPASAKHWFPWTLQSKT